MIAPLGDYGLTGVAWYQGEADVGLPGSYADRLGAMMAAWRRQFGRPDLPFVIVSLANFGPFAIHPVESGWAALREQQRLAVMRDPHAANRQAVSPAQRARPRRGCSPATQTWNAGAGIEAGTFTRCKAHGSACGPTSP